jgi:hypothetical protein
MQSSTELDAVRALAAPLVSQGLDYMIVRNNLETQMGRCLSAEEKDVIKGLLGGSAARTALDQGFAQSIKTKKSTSARKSRLSVSGMKRGLVSKVAGTKAGRAIISQFIGTEGSTILEALYQSVKLIDGNSTAKTIHEDSHKIATKLGVLIQEGKIPRANLEPINDNLTHASELMIGYLTAQNPEAVDIRTICKLIERCQDALLPLLQGQMKESNWRKSSSVADYYSSEKFMTAFIHDPALDQQRMMVLQALVSRLNREKA